ncbi:thiolase family protein [Bradyrhizobium sp. Arg314]
MPVHDRLDRLSGEACIVGVGDTDYRIDYLAKHSESASDSYGLAAKAFRRALADSGFGKADIDGLVVGPTLAMERTGEILGLDTRFTAQADAVNAVIQAMLAINAGLAECIALVYGNNQRTAATQYGGPTAMGGERFLAYVYYAPWGLTSQGALYAMMTNRYMAETGFRPEDLGQVSVAQRAFARLNDNAIATEQLDLQSYLDSRLICEPLRRPDYCLINDGGVALIVTTRDRARKARKPKVAVAGIGASDLHRDATSLRPRFLDFYHTGHAETAAQVYCMAGVGPKDMDLLQIYDSFSIHIPVALEGFGFCNVGEASRFVVEGGIGPGGSLPVNTSGGMLSESYMQGWNHQVEAVRQLRGEAGKRQVSWARHAQYVSDVAGKTASIIYRAERAT